MPDPEHKLYYQTPPPKGVELPSLTLAATFSILAAIAQVMVAALLQDELINGDGHSWDRANRIAAVPAGVLLAIAMWAAMRTSQGFKRVVAWICVLLGASVIVIGLLPSRYR